MGVLWTLAERGPCTFRALQDACESISPGVLNARLKELHEAGFIVKTPEGYAVTPLGTQVFRALEPLSEVSKVWAQLLQDEID